jgi:O-antigen ligase/tetratricopeptide (TPR) repeat protein
MPSPSEIAIPPDTPQSGPAISAERSFSDPANWPVALLVLMMFLLPAVGVPSELMLQDTLKSAIAAFGILGAALLFFWQQRHRTEPLLWHGMVWLPVVLMLYALGSMAWSHTYLAGVEAIRWFLLSLLMWLGLNTFTRQNLPLLLWGIHAGAVVASLWVVLQFWFDLQLFPQAAPPSSTFINRNFFAEYAVTVLPLSVYLLANFRPSRWLPVAAFSVALNVVALMMTGTRSALVALFLLLPVLMVILVRYRQQFAFTHWNRANRALVGMILLAGVCAMGSVPSGNATILHEGAGTNALQRSFHRAASMTERQEYTERSFSIRSQMWMATARMIIANPWTGVGAGAWEVQIPLYQRNSTTLETDYYAHNEWLQLLSEYGLLVGGLVMAFFLAYPIHAALTTFRLHKHQASEASPRAVILASLLTLFLVSNAGFPWHLAGCGSLLAMSFGALAASDSRLGKQKKWAVTGFLSYRPIAVAMPGVTLCCLALAIYLTEKAWQTERKIVHAIQLGIFLGQTLPPPAQPEAERKAKMMAELREGISINPHYRSFVAIAAEKLSASGDYANAARVLESVVASRPNVAALWYGLAMNYAQSSQHEQANAALQQVQRLKPDAIETVILKVTLLSKAGQDDQAIALVTQMLDAKKFDFEMLQTGYALGLKTRNQELAVRSLLLFDQTWPEHAADTYFRLGSVYANIGPTDDAKALAAFKRGLTAVPEQDKENYIKQLPERFSKLL